MAKTEIYARVLSGDMNKVCMHMHVVLKRTKLQGLVKCTYATFFGLPAPNIVPSATAKSSLRTIHGSLMDVIRETNEVNALDHGL